MGNAGAFAAPSWFRLIENCSGRAAAAAGPLCSAAAAGPRIRLAWNGFSSTGRPLAPMNSLASGLRVSPVTNSTRAAI